LEQALLLELSKESTLADKKSRQRPSVKLSLCSR
jgi:hypothetical protein